MEIFKYIDDFFDIINDPRNISPETFAQYYPDAANPKRLSHAELAIYFESANKFKRPQNWTGHKPLFSKIVGILEMADNQGVKELNSTFTYFASRARENELFNADFWVNDGILDKESITLLVAMYGAFHKNIQLEVLFEIEGLLNGREAVSDIKLDNPYPEIFIDDGYHVLKSWAPKIRPSHKKLQDCTYIFITLKKYGLMFQNVKQVQFFEILADLGINCDQLVISRWKVTDQDSIFIIP